MLLTRTPRYRGRIPFAFDLHVLSPPLTFALSQDQTLQLNFSELPKESLTVERVLNSHEFVARLRSRPVTTPSSREKLAPTRRHHGTRDLRGVFRFSFQRPIRSERTALETLRWQPPWQAALSDSGLGNLADGPSRVKNFFFHPSSPIGSAHALSARRASHCWRRGRTLARRSALSSPSECRSMSSSSCSRREHAREGRGPAPLRQSGASKKTRRRPTLPLTHASSTIGSGGLDFRVRDGIGYGPSDVATGKRGSVNPTRVAYGA